MSVPALVFLVFVFFFFPQGEIEQELCGLKAQFWRLCVVRSYFRTVRYLNSVSGEQGSRGGWIRVEIIN